MSLGLVSLLIRFLLSLVESFWRNKSVVALFFCVVFNQGVRKHFLGRGSGNDLLKASRVSCGEGLIFGDQYFQSHIFAKLMISL